MLLDGGAVEPANVALVGARNLDPPELEFIESSGLHRGEDAVERALEGTDAVYVALDCDAVEPGELAVFMPEPDGLAPGGARAAAARVAARSRRRRASASAGSCPSPRTSRSSPAWPPRPGCNRRREGQV